MSNDLACVGVCIVDPDTGVCLGCGRAPEEISGVPLPPNPPAANKNSATTPLSASQYPLPPQVARQAADPCD